MMYCINKHNLRNDSTPYALEDLHEVINDYGVQIRLISNRFKKVTTSFPKQFDENRFTIHGLESVNQYDNHVDLLLKPFAILNGTYIMECDFLNLLSD